MVEGGGAVSSHLPDSGEAGFKTRSDASLSSLRSAARSEAEFGELPGVQTEGASFKKEEPTCLSSLQRQFSKIGTGLGSISGHLILCPKHGCLRFSFGSDGQLNSVVAATALEFYGNKRRVQIIQNSMFVELHDRVQQLSKLPPCQACAWRILRGFKPARHIVTEAEKEALAAQAAECACFKEVTMENQSASGNSEMQHSSDPHGQNSVLEIATEQNIADPTEAPSETLNETSNKDLNESSNKASNDTLNETKNASLDETSGKTLEETSDKTSNETSYETQEQVQSSPSSSAETASSSQSPQPPMSDSKSECEDSALLPAKEETDAAHATRRNGPLVCLVVGMAGSGKSTLVNAMREHLTNEGLRVYCVNLDPAVREVAFPANVDIRDSVNYRRVMEHYRLGPNGAILTSLNLFATRFGDLLDLLQRRSDSLDVVLVDTPGQIEVFTWSASGTLISEALAGSFPTAVVYVLDSSRSAAPQTLLSNMLHACSVLYRHRLPFLALFNKIDAQDPSQCLEWIRDYDSFQEALLKDQRYVASLCRSTALALATFYERIETASVSAVTRKGFECLKGAIGKLRNEYLESYLPFYEEAKRKSRRTRGTPAEESRSNDPSSPLTKRADGN